MSRIWCWLGLHDWIASYRIDVASDYVVLDYRKCLRCEAEEEWR